MAKKGSLDKTRAVPVEPIPKKKKTDSGGIKVAVPEELTPKMKKSNSGQKKLRNEIDEIFSDKKKRKGTEEQTKNQKEATGSKLKKLKRDKSKAHEHDGFVDPPSKPKKKTSDGLILYTEEELGIGKSDAGGCFGDMSGS